MARSSDPLEFLLRVMNNNQLEVRVRVRAAIAAAQYVHTRTRDRGKKGDRERAAEAVMASGRFTPVVVPKSQ